MADLIYETPRRRQQPGVTAKARAKRKRAVQKVAKSVRAEVVTLAQSCCERCGIYCGDCGHAHHRLPRSRGGKWTVENIEYLCPGCHLEAHLTNAL